MIVKVWKKYVLVYFETVIFQIYSIQKKQVETGTYNFERSQAQYNLGSITAIEFRQAQINLRNAQNKRTLAKYQVKLAELTLLQLCGQLLNISL